MAQPPNRVYYSNVDGAVLETPSEKDPFERPRDLRAAYRYDQRMDEKRAEWRNDFVDHLEREALALALDPPPAVRAELERILAVEGLEVPWLGLRRRVREELTLVHDQLWRQLAREAEAARSTQADATVPDRAAGAAAGAGAGAAAGAAGRFTRLVAWARRHR